MSAAPVTAKMLATYQSLLEEVKYRIEAIDNILMGKTTPLRVKIAEELCYLQLRMTCELIAIGCLILHGNLKPKADLFKTYKADWIMSELEKLHPKFYPFPLTARDGVGPGGTPAWIDKTSGFLTKDELGTLWGRVCGPRLHRGNAKNILVKDPPLDFPTVRSWRNKIVELLERHTILSSDEDWCCFFVMNQTGTGKVGGNVFRKLDGHPIPAAPANDHTQ